MSKHTPGPWSHSNEPFEKSDCGVLRGHVTVDAPSHGAIAQVVWRMEDAESSPECEANARLIAAAPDLLEALESIRLYANDTLSGRADGPDDREWQRAAVLELRNRARAAIAKAEGRS